MKCAWNELLAILPTWMREDTDRQGRETLQEIRIRAGRVPELILNGKSFPLSRPVTDQDISFCLNTATQYSPWTSESIARGYFACAGGHRMGICGEAVMRNGIPQGIKNIRSLCIRVARDLPGCSCKIADIHKSLLILGPPGSGKTTLLRDLIRRISNSGFGSISVADERGEIFPPGVFDEGPRTDVLTGCAKAQGLDLLIRTMGPAYAAVDEITAKEDCDALIAAGNCGVKLLATAHASCMEDLHCRPVYRELVKSGLFENVVILHQDKSLRTERMACK